MKLLTTTTIALCFLANAATAQVEGKENIFKADTIRVLPGAMNEFSYDSKQYKIDHIKGGDLIKAGIRQEGTLVIKAADNFSFANMDIIYNNGRQKRVVVKLVAEDKKY